MAATENTIAIEVAYAAPDQQCLISLTLSSECDIRQALQASEIFRLRPELKPEEIEVGIFGNLCRLDTRPVDGDRIEIYRPLTQDPKAARRQRLRN